MKCKETKTYYKIWDIRNKKYISGQRSKTTWNSIPWIVTKIKNLCSQQTYGGFRKMEDFEIHEMEMTFKNIINPIDVSDNGVKSEYY